MFHLQTQYVWCPRKSVDVLWPALLPFVHMTFIAALKLRTSPRGRSSLLSSPQACGVESKDEPKRERGRLHENRAGSNSSTFKSGVRNGAPYKNRSEISFLQKKNKKKTRIWYCFVPAQKLFGIDSMNVASLIGFAVDRQGTMATTYGRSALKVIRACFDFASRHSVTG